MDTHARKTLEDVVADRQSKRPIQISVENSFRSEAERKKTCLYIAKWMYEHAIPFNVVNSRSFEEMVEAIGQFGSGLRPPTYHEVRVRFLKELKDQTDQMKKGYEECWKVYGCTLMSDVWTDKRGRSVINFLVNCPEGTYFLGSVDASGYVHDANWIFSLLDSKVEEIGEDYVMQVCTENAANYGAACKLLMQKRKKLYWTPCAAYCINLMLHDIGKLKAYEKWIVKAKKMTSFIYRHTRLLDAMRVKTGGNDLVRAGATRFASSFLTLQSLFKFKDALKQLFVSDDWQKCKLAATEVGKKVVETVLSTSFWNSVKDCLRAMQPLMIVLRIVDGDEKPALAEVYMAMEEAKRKIKFNFSDKERLWKPIIDIVERHWMVQMDRPLYSAAFFLNPGQYIEWSKTATDAEQCLIFIAFTEVCDRMLPDADLHDKVLLQSELYKASIGMYGKPMALKQQKSVSPFLWWKMNGISTPELRRFAMQIVGLCCSASGCERNWSTFEHILTKKRNRLEHQRLNDLVYIQFNRRLQARFKYRQEKGKNTNPLVLEELDWNSDWMTGAAYSDDEEIVHHGDDLTWETVDRAIGASAALDGHNLPRRAVSNVCYTRHHGGRDIVPSNSDSDEELEVEDVNDDEHVEDDFGLTATTNPIGQGQRQEELSDDFIADF